MATLFYRALSITKLLVSLILTVFQVHSAFDLNPRFYGHVIIIISQLVKEMKKINRIGKAKGQITTNDGEVLLCFVHMCLDLMGE